MTLQDKEQLITDVKRKSLSEPALYPMENFLLADQKIFSSKFLTDDLEKTVQECIENGCLIIFNEMPVNAYAYTRKGYSVVAITFGSIYKCIYAANLFMLSEDYFPDIGDVRACYSDVTAAAYPPKVGKGGEVLFHESGDDERRDAGYIIAAFAMKYIVYHEIGHHALGHLQKYNHVLGLECGEAGEGMRSRISPDEFKLIEMGADIYAVQKLVGEFDELSQRWSPYFEVPLGHLELVLLLMTALVIVKENLNEELLSVKEIDDSAYPPMIMRLVVSLYITLETDKKLPDEYRQALILSAEVEGKESAAVNIDDESLKNMMMDYMINAVVSFEQIYADIFLGRHDQEVFQSDFLGSEWWQRLE